MARQVPAGLTEVSFLREELRQHKISQKALAAAIGLEESAMSRTLSGRRAAPAWEIAQALLYLGALTGRPEVAAKLLPPTWEEHHEYRAIRLRAALRHGDLGVARLSERSGVGIETIEAFLSHVGPPVPDEIAEKLGASLSLSLAALSAPPDLLPGRTTRPVTAAHPSNQLQVSTALDGPLIVYRPPVLREDGAFDWTEVVSHQRLRPDLLAGAMDCFGFLAPSLALEPRYCGGEIVFVDAGRSAALGDWVLARLEDQRVAIGRIVVFQPDKVSLESGCPPRTLTINRGQVSLQPLVGAWKL